MIYFIAWPDTGDLMRKLDDGSNTPDGKPGKMYKNLGDTEKKRQRNLDTFKKMDRQLDAKEMGDCYKRRSERNKSSLLNIPGADSIFHEIINNLINVFISFRSLSVMPEVYNRASIDNKALDSRLTNHGNDALRCTDYYETVNNMDPSPADNSGIVRWCFL